MSLHALTGFQVATLDDMYGKRDPGPRPASYDVDDLRAMRAREEREALEARRQKARAALSGRRFINEATTSLDVQGASSGDYRKIFAMYQGLSLLEAITDRAGQRGVSALENAQLSKRFDAGMAELSAFLKDSSFEGLRMVEGVSATKAQTGAGVARKKNDRVDRGGAGRDS